MRATLNIVFAFLLLVMQAAALVAPHSVEKAKVCKCCSCGSNACTTTTRTATPASAPLAAQIQESRDQVRKIDLRPVFQPALSAPQVRVAHSPVFPVSVPSTASPQPLYERFCLLLI